MHQGQTRGVENAPSDRQCRNSPGGRAQSVVAGLGYLTSPVARPYSYMHLPPEGEPWTNCSFDVRPMQIHDGRGQAQTSIHREGFELREMSSDVGDFQDDDEVKRLYYREVEEFACLVTGAQHAHVFDHLVRKREAGRPPLSFGRETGDGVTPTAIGRIHNDYTEASGRKRLGLVLNDPAACLSVRRYSIVNVWRSINGPVLDTPLAVCDARTVAAEELVSTEIRYPSRTGEIYLLQYGERHRWSYFSGMGRGEALIFKQYESALDIPARFTPHGAFDHPDVPADAPLRQSIEVRCLVIYT